MSFRPQYSDVALCNRALSLISQAPISALAPPTPAGTPSRVCALWYKTIVARLLEMHHFSLATERVVLTELTNDRSNEWAYCYQLPIRCAFPVAIAPLSVTSGIQYYRGLGSLLASLRGRQLFLKVSDRLYSNVAGELDFVSFDITEADFTATFENIVVLTLASAICFDITKKQSRAEELSKRATSAMNLAITQSLNEGHPRYGELVSEAELVRGAGFLSSWDYLPGPR